MFFCFVSSDEKYAVVCTPTQPALYDFPSPPCSEYDSDDEVLVLFETVCNASSEHEDAPQQDLTSGTSRVCFFYSAQFLTLG